jgi:hypothetical protein
MIFTDTLTLPQSSIDYLFTVSNDSSLADARQYDEFRHSPPLAAHKK